MVSETTSKSLGDRQVKIFEIFKGPSIGTDSFTELFRWVPLANVGFC